MDTASRRSLKNSLADILRLVCPRCRQGRVFRGWIIVNERCPVCNLKFEREQGYFIGALYVSYLLGIPIVAALMLVYWWLTSWRLETLLLAAFLTFQLFVPIVLRFAKVVWMYADRAFDPEK